MNAEDFVKRWLDDHRSPIDFEQPSTEEQAHFENLLTDLVKARDKQMIEKACKWFEDWLCNDEEWMRRSDFVVKNTEELKRAMKGK